MAAPGQSWERKWFPPSAPAPIAGVPTVCPGLTLLTCPLCLVSLPLLAATTCWRTGLGTSTEWSATPACWRPPTPRNVSAPCSPMPAGAGSALVPSVLCKQPILAGGLQWQDHKSVTSVSLSMPTCKVGALKSEPCLSCHHCRPPLTQRCFAEHCQALGSVSSHWFSNQGRPREL